MYLAGETEARGEHLENLVLNDLLAWRDARLDRSELYYWRTAIGEEVDLVVEAGLQKDATAGDDQQRDGVPDAPHRAVHGNAAQALAAAHHARDGGHVIGFQGVLHAQKQSHSQNR